MAKKSKLNAERILALKQRVKDECLRRSKTGSVAEYGGEAYDYTTTPGAKKRVAAEHYNKIATPQNAINSDTISNNDVKKHVINDTSVTEMEAFITILEKRDVNDKHGSDCKASCTGLCYSCSGTCAEGCTGTCSGSCSGTCKGSCSGSCTGTCSGCTASCKDDCTGDCTNGCTADCVVNCGEVCQGFCISTCYQSCLGDCGSDCTGQCTTRCTGLGLLL